MNDDNILLANQALPENGLADMRTLLELAATDADDRHPQAPPLRFNQTITVLSTERSQRDTTLNTHFNARFHAVHVPHEALIDFFHLLD